MQKKDTCISQDHVDQLQIYVKGMGYKIVLDLLCMDMLHMVVY